MLQKRVAAVQYYDLEQYDPDARAEAGLLNQGSFRDHPAFK
jgi:hypothetical protein